MPANVVCAFCGRRIGVADAFQHVRGWLAEGEEVVIDGRSAKRSEPKRRSRVLPSTARPHST